MKIKVATAVCTKCGRRTLKIFWDEDFFYSNCIFCNGKEEVDTKEQYMVEDWNELKELLYDRTND